MMESSFTFARIRGIPVGAHWSWLFVFALFVWSLSSALFPRTYPGLDGTTYLVMGLVAAGLFFASILFHELGHAFRALREGMQIDGIALWLFGGVARFKGMFPSAGAEFRIAIAGPVVSAVIAALFGALTLAGSALGWPDAARGVVDYLWRINAVVLAFNLVPALPLDGGRVLRAWLWHRQRSFAAATTSAAAAGKGFGGLLIGVGLLDFFTGRGGAGGLWLVFLGWFLIQAAQAESSTVLVHQLLRGRRVGDLMTPDPVAVTPELTIAEFLDRVVQPRGHSTYPVLDRDRLVGLVSLRRSGQVPPSERARRRVADVMLPAQELTVFSPRTDMAEALPALDEEPRRAPVVDDGRVVGILSISDVTRALELERMREPRPRASARAGAAVWVVVAAIMALAVAAIYHPPFAVVRPGVAVDISREITITGVPTERPHGKYLLTSVQLQRPSALGLLVAAVGSDREIVSLSEVMPAGADRREFVRTQRELFRQSRVVAAAAAARAAGLDAVTRGTGAVVEDVLPSAPAARQLRRGDVIVEINGQPIALSTDLQETIRSRPAGTLFQLGVERDGRVRELRVSSARLPAVAEGAVGIGVMVSTRDFDIDLPFEIEFRERPIGGPSAGLAYALAIADMLDAKDYARGKTIAATGSVDLEGNVGPVGGVEPKASAVQELGAHLLLVPQGQVDEADAEELEVRGVSNLEQALRALS